MRPFNGPLLTVPSLYTCLSIPRSIRHVADIDTYASKYIPWNLCDPRSHVGPSVNTGLESETCDLNLSPCTDTVSHSNLAFVPLDDHVLLCLLCGETLSCRTCACAASHGSHARNIAVDDDVCQQQRVLRQHSGVAASSVVLVRQRATSREHPHERAIATASFEQRKGRVEPVFPFLETNDPADYVRVSLYACADSYGDDVSPSRYRVSYYGRRSNEAPSARSEERGMCDCGISRTLADSGKGRSSSHIGMRACGGPPLATDWRRVPSVSASASTSISSATQVEVYTSFVARVAAAVGLD